MEDLRRQQQDDRERISALEKQLNVVETRYRHSLDGLRREVGLSQGCCDSVRNLHNRISDAERKISSASENLDVLEDRLEKGLSGEGGSRGGSSAAGSGLGGSGQGGGSLGGGGQEGGDQKGSGRGTGSLGGGGFGGHGQGGGDQKGSRRGTGGLGDGSEGGGGHGGGGQGVFRCEQSCSQLESNLKEYFHREVGDLRAVFLDRFDDQAFRIADVELDVSLVKDRVSDHDKKLENVTSQVGRKLEECSCDGVIGGKPPPGDRGGWGAGGRGVGPTGGGETGGSGWREGDRQGGVTGGGGLGRVTEGGGATEGGGERGGERTVEKSLEWRVVANEDQIRHFNTRLRDLSVSGDSLQDQVSHAHLHLVIHSCIDSGMVYWF